MDTVSSSLNKFRANLVLSTSCPDEQADQAQLKKAIEVEQTDPQQAFNIYSALANKGCVEAEFRCAVMLSQGEGTLCDLSKALEYLQLTPQQALELQQLYTETQLKEKIAGQEKALEALRRCHNDEHGDMDSAAQIRFGVELLKLIHAKVSMAGIGQNTITQADIDMLLSTVTDELKQLCNDAHRMTVVALSNNLGSWLAEAITEYNQQYPEVPGKFVCDEVSKPIHDGSGSIPTDCWHQVGKYLKVKENHNLSATSKSHTHVVRSNPLLPALLFYFSRLQKKLGISEDEKKFSQFLNDFNVQTFKVKIASMPYDKPHRLLLCFYNGLSQNPYIKAIELDISFCDMWAGDMEQLATLKQITSLNLSGNKPHSEGLKNLAPLTNLTSLDVSRSHLGPEGIKPLMKFTNLTELDVSSNGLGVEGVKFLATLTKLRSLQVNFERGVKKSLEDLTTLTNLTSLIMRNNSLGPEEVKHLTTLSNLRLLELARNRLGSEGFKLLATLTCLEILGIEASKLDPRDAVHLAMFTNLRSLDVRGSQLGREIANYLTVLSHLTKLIIKPDELGPEDESTLLAKLPNLQIRESPYI